MSIEIKEIKSITEMVIQVQRLKRNAQQGNNFKLVEKYEILNQNLSIIRKLIEKFPESKTIIGFLGENEKVVRYVTEVMEKYPEQYNDSNNLVFRKTITLLKKIESGLTEIVELEKELAVKKIEEERVKKIKENEAIIVARMDELMPND